MGGTTFDRSAREFRVLSDIHIFQLRDAYYKYCSVTGAGLFAAVAGISTPFYIQCLDAFGEPAMGASFLVDITGKENQPGMKPAPVALRPLGQYKCEYTAFAIGEYEIRIKVGRGGSAYMDLIEGEDSEPSNEVHDYIFKTTSRLEEDATTPQIFKLVVSPGETNSQTSVATGAAITASTSGNIGTFLITARDTFGNRRPGGDTVSALMRYWSTVNNSEADASQLPKTGSIVDNKDGSYAVSYRITRAGIYQHSISFAGVVGAGSPVFLRVDSDEADLSRTYVYGAVLELSTGNPSTIYVQTRDQFGNHLRYTNVEKPCSGYPLTLETCDQQLEYELCFSKEVPCPVVETNLGKKLTYQMGPNAKTTDSYDEPYYGLYQIVVYPLGEAGGNSYTPIVKHNGQYVQCYFDSGSPAQYQDLAAYAREADPGWRLANACADLKKDQTSRRIYRRNEAGGMWAPTAGVIRVEDRGRLATLFESAQSEFGVAGVERRGVKEINWDTTQLTVKQQFKEPDTELLERYLHLTPWLCAMIGVLMAVMHALWDAYEVKRDAKVHALIADMDQDGEGAGGAVEASKGEPLTNEKTGSSTLDWALEEIEEADPEAHTPDKPPKEPYYPQKSPTMEADAAAHTPDEPLDDTAHDDAADAGWGEGGGESLIKDGWQRCSPQLQPQTARELPTSRLSTPKRHASALRATLASSPSPSAPSAAPTLPADGETASEARTAEDWSNQHDMDPEDDETRARQLGLLTLPQEDDETRARQLGLSTLPQSVSPVPPPMPAEM